MRGSIIIMISVWGGGAHIDMRVFFWYGLVMIDIINIRNNATTQRMIVSSPPPLHITPLLHIITIMLPPQKKHNATNHNRCNHNKADDAKTTHNAQQHNISSATLCYSACGSIFAYCSSIIMHHQHYHYFYCVAIVVMVSFLVNSSNTVLQQCVCVSASQ